MSRRKTRSLKIRQMPKSQRLHLREMPSDGDNNGYNGVGNELLVVRRQHGLDLDTVSRELRIQYSHLDAIETGRFEDLPGPAYAIGFLPPRPDARGGSYPQPPRSDCILARPADCCPT